MVSEQLKDLKQALPHVTDIMLADVRAKRVVAYTGDEATASAETAALCEQAKDVLGPLTKGAIGSKPATVAVVSTINDTRIFIRVPNARHDTLVLIGLTEIDLQATVAVAKTYLDHLMAVEA
ncbi:MAG: hypothetical protein AAF871_02930 [Pseudomonadota bacterium]